MAYITKINAAFPADRFFPNLDDDENWLLQDSSDELEQDGVTFHYHTYIRK